MEHISLYRKYRPARFEDTIGQEHIVKTLKNQIKNGRISHAYLFCGTRGTGKTSLAKIFAKAVNCLSPRDGEPCGACGLCAEIAAERSPNVIEIDAASNNGVDDIRALREEVRYTPAVGTYKVYIVDEVHMLSAGAYNALLKTLEEPPSFVVFILATTDPQKVPVTILSRCQRYDFKRISAVEIAERLRECLLSEGISADSDAISYVARLSDGSMRDALSILDRCVSFCDVSDGEASLSLSDVLEITGSVSVEGFFRLTDALNEMNAADAIMQIDEFARGGRDINRIIMEAISHFRSLIIAKTTKNPKEILSASTENVERLVAEAEKVDMRRLIAYVNAFDELRVNSKYSQEPRVLLEIQVIRLCNPEIMGNTSEEVYGKILALEKAVELAGKNVQRTATHGGDNADYEHVAEQPAEEILEKTKVFLSDDLIRLKAAFPDIISYLKESDKNFTEMALTVLERVDVGFIGNDAANGGADGITPVLLFDDTVNMDFLTTPEKLEGLYKATKKVANIDVKFVAMMREQYSAKNENVEYVERKNVPQEIANIFGGIDGLEIETE